MRPDPSNFGTGLFFFFFLVTFFLMTISWEGLHGQLVPKLPRNDDHEILLKEILDFRKTLTTPPLSRQEDIRVLGSTLDQKKILFLNKIYENGKRKQDLILFHSQKKEIYHYRFNNPVLYKNKKKKIITQNDIIMGSLRSVSVESIIVKHPLLPADLLIQRENEISSRGNYPVLPSLEISLDNGIERFLLGKIQSTRIHTSPINIEKMYLSDEGRIAVFILSHTYRKDNTVHQQIELVGFDLYEAIVNPLNKVTADQEFSLSPEQKNLPFIKIYYYNERDEFLFSEILFHSGQRFTEGNFTFY